LDRVGAADRLHARLRQPEVPDLAVPDEVLHRAGNVLDRNVRIDSVLIEQIDDVGPEALEQSLGNLLDVLRPAIQAAGRALNVEAELGCDHHLFTDGRKGFTDERLVRERTVDFGRRR
jgi:hypothetical protein